MSRPCENCGSDIRVCQDCDLYKGKFIEIPADATNKDVLEAVWPGVTCEGRSLYRHVNGKPTNLLAVHINQSWLKSRYKDTDTDNLHITFEEAKILAAIKHQGIQSVVEHYPSDKVNHVLQKIIKELEEIQSSIEEV